MNEKERGLAARTVGRRRLLRRASGLAAGVAGAAVVGAAVAPSAAEAAPGGNFILGQDNDAGGNATGLSTNSGSQSTLELSNSNVTTGTIGVDTVDFVGAQVRLSPPKATTNPQVPAMGEVGSLALTNDGTLWLVAEQNTADWVYTTFTANQLVAIAPTRVLDTRSVAGRAHILDAAGNLDGSGRLLGGHAINIDLSSFVNFGTAVHANLTIVLPDTQGFASLLPGGQPINGQPSTSNVNYVATDVAPNFALCAIGADLGSNDVVKVYSSSTTHVLLDVFAFTVNFPGQVHPGLAASFTGATPKAQLAPQSRAELARTNRPNWSK